MQVPVDEEIAAIKGENKRGHMRSVLTVKFLSYVKFIHGNEQAEKVDEVD